MVRAPDIIVDGVVLRSSAEVEDMRARRLLVKARSM